MNIVKAIIEIVVYGLCLYWAYKLYNRYNIIVGAYIDEVVNDWPKVPNWLNWLLGILLFLGCVFVQTKFFFESLIIWLILLFIIPFFYLPIKNGKTYNILSATTFFIISFFSVTLFFSVDNSRDIIGEVFISNYDVYYTTEYYQTQYDDREVEVPHINTGNEALDFFLESIFPYAYRIFIVFICIFSFLLNISFREKNKLFSNSNKNSS